MVADLLGDIEYLIAVLCVNAHGLADDLALAALVGLEGNEHLRANRCHLGTALDNNDVSKNAAAVCRSGLIEHVVLVVAEVDSVCGKAGLERDHHARSKVTAEAGCTVKDDRGLVLLGKLSHSLLIGTCTVGCKCCVLCNDDLVCTVCDEGGGKRLNVAAKENGVYILAVVSLKLLRLCKKLKCYGVENTVLLLGKYP